MSSSEPILAALRKMEDSLFDRLTTEMDRRFGETRLDFNGRFDAIEVRLERLETEYLIIVAALQRLEQAVAEDRGERARLRADVAVLKQKVAELDARVDVLEQRLADDQD